MKIKPKTVAPLTEEEIKEEKKKYTTKIEIPIYEPNDTVPDIRDLYNTEKRDELIEEINNAEIYPELKQFLLLAAERHVIFNFSKIADFYAHIPVKYKFLFENSALVIIDYDSAIRNGFVSFEKEVEKSRIEYLENVLTNEQMAINRSDVSVKKQKRAEEEIHLLKRKDEGQW